VRFERILKDWVPLMYTVTGSRLSLSSKLLYSQNTDTCTGRYAAMFLAL